MTYLLDVNVLVALFWPNHNHNKPAQAWFEGVKRFATCPITELGFLRVSSNTALQYSASIEDACEALRLLTARAGHTFWQDELPALHVSVPQSATHGQLTDSYLVGLAKN